MRQQKETIKKWYTRKSQRKWWNFQICKREREKTRILQEQRTVFFLYGRFYSNPRLCCCSVSVCERYSIVHEFLFFNDQIIRLGIQTRMYNTDTIPHHTHTSHTNFTMRELRRRDDGLNTPRYWRPDTYTTSARYNIISEFFHSTIFVK
jgi:hypothetical protein